MKKKSHNPINTNLPRKLKKKLFGTRSRSKRACKRFFIAASCAYGAAIAMNKVSLPKALIYFPDDFNNVAGCSAMTQRERRICFGDASFSHFIRMLRKEHVQCLVKPMA